MSTVLAEPSAKSPLADELLKYDATSLAEAIRARTFSAFEVVAAHFERIDRLNEKFNALVTLDRDRALARARQADADLARGKIWGPLHGVPITIKDALQTAGLRTTAGSRKYADFIPEQDAWVVARLKQAGAIMLGKSNCPPLCADVQTRNEIFGATHNPWDVERTSGGSSGGEAAAVALGLSPLGIGSDTAGSIRTPCSYCGVFGLKPSINAISTEGLLPHSPFAERPDSLTVVGPIARSVRDLSLCYEILTGAQAQQPSSGTPPKIYWTQEFPRPVLDDEIAGVLSNKFAELLECGTPVRKVDAPFDFDALTMMAFRLMMFEFTPREGNLFFLSLFWLYEVARAIVRGEVGRPYRTLKQEQAAMSLRVEDFMKDCDCWVLPVTSSVAFPHQSKGRHPIPITVNGRKTRRAYFPAAIGFTSAFNLLGNPSVVIPIGRNRNNLPISIQVVGKRGEDMKLLRAAGYLAVRLANSHGKG